MDNIDSMDNEDDFGDISSKTWSRAVESIAKNGYMEGASEGRDSAFQDSFDLGYEEGFKYGMNIGFHRALTRACSQDEDIVPMIDSQKVNCQICLNRDLLQQHSINIDNTQKENNTKNIAKIQENINATLEDIGTDFNTVLNNFS